MARNNAAIPADVLGFVRAVLQPFDDGGREVEGIPDEDGCLRCTMPLLNGVGQDFPHSDAAGAQGEDNRKSGWDTLPQLGTVSQAAWNEAADTVA